MDRIASLTTETATGGPLTPRSRRIGFVALVVALVALAGVAVAGSALAETTAPDSGQSATLDSYTDPGTASLTINETSRTVADTELAPGGSTTVEVVVTTKDSLGSAELFEIEEQFSPAFGDVELQNMDPGGSAGPGPNNEEFLAIWSTTNETYTLTYEVTLPADAEPGDTFTIDGTVTTGDTSEQLPSATITASGDIPDETSVRLEPSSDSAEPGDQTTFDVVVEGAGNGIGAYDMTVTSSDANVGEIVDYSLANDAATDNSQIAADGSSVDLDADLSNTHEAATTITVATITVEAGEEGTSDFAFDSTGVDDTGGTSYTIDSTEGSTLTVSEEPDPSETVSLSLQPADSEVQPGAQQTYELVVEGPANGIGSYDATITVGDTTVAEITDARAFQTSVGLFDTTIAADGSSVQFSGLVQFDAASQLTLAEIDVAAADTTGETSLDLSVADIADSDASSYRVESATGATLTVSEDAGPPPLPDQDNAPQDLDGDGLYEDVNGDDQFSIADVQIFFQNRDSDAVQNNPEAFNFDETDPPAVTIGDVQALFIAFTQSS